MNKLGNLFETAKYSSPPYSNKYLYNKSESEYSNSNGSFVILNISFVIFFLLEFIYSLSGTFIFSLS